MWEKLIGLGTKALGGIWGYVAAFGVGTIIATSATYYVVHNANAVEISDLKLQASEQRAVNVTASLNQLTGFINTMHVAALGYQTYVASVEGYFGKIEQDLHHATAQKPLPPDCVPDAGRLRTLTDATRAANGATGPR